jgi:hypothetical protein
MDAWRLQPMVRHNDYWIVYAGPIAATAEALARTARPDALSDEARKELIALTLLGRGDFDHSHERAVETCARYTTADDQVLYLMGKTVRLAEYLRIALGALSRNAGAEERWEARGEIPRAYSAKPESIFDGRMSASAGCGHTAEVSYVVSRPEDIDLK